MSLQTRLAIRCEERNKRAGCCEGVMFILVSSFFFMSWSTDFFVVCRLSLTSLASVVWRLNASLKLNSIPPSTRLWVPVSKALLSKVVLTEWQVGLLYIWLPVKRSCSDSGAYWLRSICCCTGMVGHCLAPEVLGLWCFGIGNLVRLINGLMLKQWMWVVFFDFSLI